MPIDGCINKMPYGEDADEEYVSHVSCCTSQGTYNRECFCISQRTYSREYYLYMVLSVIARLHQAKVCHRVHFVILMMTKD